MMPSEVLEPTTMLSQSAAAVAANAVNESYHHHHHLRLHHQDEHQLRCSESVASSVLQDLSFGSAYGAGSSVAKRVCSGGIGGGGGDVSGDEVMTMESSTTTPLASPAVHLAMSGMNNIEALHLNGRPSYVQKTECDDSDMMCPEEGNAIGLDDGGVTRRAIVTGSPSPSYAAANNHHTSPPPTAAAEEEFDANSWEMLINRLPSAVVRRLLLSSIQEHEGVRATVHANMIQEVNQWREARLARLMNRLKRSVLKLEISSFHERLVKIANNTSDCWEEQHAIVLEFCRTMESYMFGAYEVGCDFRKHYPLCIEIFYMVIEGAQKLSQVPTQFDVSETLSDWNPATRYVPESFSKAKGFVSCVFRLWSHVLHVSTIDADSQQNPTKIHKLFVWSVMHDPQRQLLVHLTQFEGNTSYSKNVAMEVYQHFAGIKNES
eukprot:TRINITY_DN1532_c0_g1_i1.p1 TRINITY_DN1532_c0_g1~~TRINITY_DN1532_c0_g1_i1.p1  ORF type:complete len:434 (-),score=68.55 TRINITY_DN1532_c0_g1_i1:1483-2784(-)